jgi:hypothetical protein
MARKTTVVLSDGEEVELELKDDELHYLLSVPAPMIVFISIAKARSRLFEQIARRNYEPRRWGELANMFTDPERSRAELAGWAQKPGGIDLLSGEIAFDAEAAPPEARYFTLLRDPVERATSQAASVHRQAGREGQIPKEMSLDDAIVQGKLQTVDNLQTRQLAGATLDDPPRGECPRELLETATENVAEHIQFTGVTERFDESVVLIARAYGWDDFAYPPVHPNLPDLKPEAVERLRAENALDLELYKFAEDRFSAAVGEAGAEFELDLKALRRCSALLEGANGKPESPEIEERATQLRARYEQSERRGAQRAEQQAARRQTQRARGRRSAKSG